MVRVLVLSAIDHINPADAWLTVTASCGLTPLAKPVMALLFIDRGPVIPADPLRGRLPVISLPTSFAKLLNSADAMVVSVTAMVPLGNE